MKRTLTLALLICYSILLKAQSGWQNIADNGADRTGKIKCTQIINGAIEKLASEGGGTVYFPAGTFLTGPIMMKSNITLYLDGAAVVKFSDDFDDYLPMVQSRWEDIRVKNFRSQIYAYQCENITITGRGHFEGQGQKWWDFMRALPKQQTESKWQEIFRKENAELLLKNDYLKSRKNFLRPPMVTTYECKDVLIEGVSFSNPPFWTIMPAFTDNITISGITIENPGNSPNTDGIDPSSCRNVHITNCHITVGDDCIVIKSGRDEDGREAGRPTENVTISNCTMLRGHGGVVIGSEMSAGVKRIAITNCVFEGTDRGIRIKTMRGRGGVIEDMVVSNIVMNNMINEGVLITLRYQRSDPEPVSERTPACNNLRFSNIIVNGGQRPAAIYGLDERDVTHVSFSDFESKTAKGILVENGSDISFHNIKLTIKEGSALEAKDSKNISWDLVSVNTQQFNSPVIKLINCNGLRVSNCLQTEAIPLYVSEDEKSSGFYVMNNMLPNTISLLSNKGKDYFVSNNIVKKEVRDEEVKWSVRMANTVLSQADSLTHYVSGTPKWAYDVAFMGMAIDKLGNVDPKYSKYMENWVNYFVHPDGSVTDYKLTEYNLDRIFPGRDIITLYKRNPDPKYKIAIDNFVEQLKTHPKTKSGGYWHKNIYPWQMWLDGIFMASTYMAQYAAEFNAPQWFDVATGQVKMIYEKTLDPATGLLMHAWDESRTQKWCDPATGKSQFPWSRAMGWYTLAILDILDYLPADHPDRKELVGILQKTCDALVKVRDPKSGIWYQVLNQGNREGNYLEGSGSAMYIYVFAKGARLGYLDKKYRDIANKAFNDYLKTLVTVDEKGRVTIHNICGGCGLGGNPYRDGSYEYYVSEKRYDNDTKGVSPFILAAIELDK